MVTGTPELDTFQAAFGRRCVMAAQALDAGLSREAVRIAFSGHGENLKLEALRLSRVGLNEAAEAAVHGLESRGLERTAAIRVLMERMRTSREAVESEWGFTIPIVNVA
jgi:hypothetical protein